jgi:predicted nucleic acid-binding protein
VIFYFDTSVIVAASVNDHPHFPQAFAALRQAADKRNKASTSAHGLAETYSVLTRAPFNPPVYPNEAWQILEQNVLRYFEVITLSASEYREVIRDCAVRGWAGGRIYDALHLRCARKQRCERIHTLNVRDFRDLAPENLEIEICAP